MTPRERLQRMKFPSGCVCNIGGDKKQTTSNTSASYDQRQVFTDSQNQYDLSNNSVNTTNTSTTTAWNDASTNNSNNTNEYDLSNRSVSSQVSNTSNSTANSYDLSNKSVNNTSTSTDSSDRSVRNTSTAWTDASTTNTSTSNSSDNSNRSTNYTTTNTTDGGAVAGALSFAKDAGAGAFDSLKSALGFAASVASGQQASVIHGYDYAGGIFDTAVDALNKNDARALDAFDRAATISRDALSMSGVASAAALTQVQNAYADAKGTTQASQKMIFAVLAVAGVAILAMKKG